jgi:hypothetical protein
VEVALAFDETPAGREWLDAWEASTHLREKELSTLMDLRAALGQPERALQCARRLYQLSGKGETLECIGRHAIARYSRMSGDFAGALATLEPTIALILSGRGWLGIQISAAEELLNLVDSPGAPAELRTAALAHADRIMRGHQTSLVMLRRMTETAERIQRPDLAAFYAQAAESERQRIERSLGDGIC